MVLDKDIKEFKNKWDEHLEENLKKMKVGRTKYLEKQKRDKTRAVYEIIRLYSIKKGITMDELSAIVGMNRKSLRPYTDNLKREKLITHGKNGYLPTQSFVKDLVFNTEIFSESIVQLLKKESPIVLNDQKKCTLFTSDVLKPDTASEHEQIYRAKEYDFTTYRSLFQFSNDNKLEKSLFEFSNRIGAIVTYLLIYCMDPHNYTDELSSLGNDEYLRRSFEAGMNNLNHFLPDIFAIYLKNLKYREKVLLDDSQVLLNQESFSEILNAFVRLYPLMSYEFEKILDKRHFFHEVLDGWSSKIEDYKIVLNAIHGKLKEQESCNHEFSTKRSELSENFKQCIKCEKTFNVKAISRKRKKIK